MGPSQCKSNDIISLKSTARQFKAHLWRGERPVFKLLLLGVVYLAVAGALLILCRALLAAGIAGLGLRRLAGRRLLRLRARRLRLLLAGAVLQLAAAVGLPGLGACLG